VLGIEPIMIEFKDNFVVGHQWLMPMILATQEAKIRRIRVQSQPREILHETPS
jgi:hypothetical protein